MSTILLHYFAQSRCAGALHFGAIAPIKHIPRGSQLIRKRFLSSTQSNFVDNLPLKECATTTRALEDN
ncbi:hypothetical protein DO72_5187 [Burkholderia pseudomallei]|nr:hypothetical protein DO72_5187 [Burkholderia pseudomallei]